MGLEVAAKCPQQRPCNPHTCHFGACRGVRRGGSSGHLRSNNESYQFLLRIIYSPTHCFWGEKADWVITSMTSREEDFCTQNLEQIISPPLHSCHLTFALLLLRSVFLLHCVRQRSSMFLNEKLQRIQFINVS